MRVDRIFASALRQVVAAVDVDELADDVAGVVGGEEHDDVRDVLRFGEPTSRGAPRQLGKLRSPAAP